MPILPDDDAIKRLRIWDGIGETLPDLTGALATADPDALAEWRVRYQLQTATIWERGTQKQFGAVIANIGQPAGPTYVGMLNAVAMDPDALNVLAILYETLGARLTKIAQNQIEEALRQGIGLVAKLATAIPIIGLAAKIAIDVGFAINDLVRLVKTQDDEPDRVWNPAAFDPGSDVGFADMILRTMANEHDWTRIVEPPGAGSRAQFVPDFTAAPLSHGGLRVASTDLGSGKLGYIPGTATITRQYETSGTLWLDTGRYFPSARDLALTCWGMATKNSPAMYCVNGYTAASRWRTYLGTLRDWIQETDKLSNEEKRNFVRHLTADLDWAPFSTRSQPGNWDNYGIERTKPVRRLKAHAQRQMGYLDTLTCAYVTLDFAAFRGDANLQAKWRNNRRTLLQHPARCLVDLDNVPDHDYRLELESRGVGGPRCSLAGSLGLPEEPAEPIPPELKPYIRTGTDRELGPGRDPDVVITPRGTIFLPSAPESDAGPQLGTGAGAVMGLAAAGVVIAILLRTTRGLV